MEFNEDFSLLSDAELLALYHKEADMAEVLDLQQHATKILLNSIYGALGNAYFLYYDIRCAESITSYGRLLIKYIGEEMNQYLIEKLGENDGHRYTVYIDTDSVTGDTLVNYDGIKIPIEYLYNAYATQKPIKNNGKEFVYNCSGLTKSYNTESHQIEEKPIKYVMKHSVEKEMFQIEEDGYVVRVTADHSIIVMRDGKAISVKPAEIIENDKLILDAA